MDGYLTYTQGAGGSWIAWHTRTAPPEGATGREIAACGGPVLFAIGATREDALARLTADHPDLIPD